MRTTLAVILSVVLPLTFIYQDAYASKTPSSSTVGIEFSSQPGINVEIFDPNEVGQLPDIPGFMVGPEHESMLRGLDSMALHFGNDLVISDLDAQYYSRNQAGIIVRSNVNWEVVVAIDGFKQGSEQTLKGFELTLTPEGNGVNITNSASISPRVAERLTADINGNIGDGQKVATGNSGIMGCNYNGTLHVVGKTAKPGIAKATLYWTILPGAP